MTQTTWNRMLLAPIAALAIAAAACGGEPAETSPALDTAEISATENQINAMSRDQVQDGGTMTWTLTSMPVNFNYNHLDGTLRDNAEVMQALMPGPYRTDATATPVWNPDFLAAEPLLATEPRQVVTYEIHPEATWYDGTPITWEDFRWQWRASNGTDDAYIVAATNGYDAIASVEMGTHEREVVVTYRARYADWQALFDPLFPASTNRDPEFFNTGWLNQPLTSAGPFRLDNVDRTAQTITIVRNERWWGPPAKLDRIVFRPIDANAQIDALANGEVDFMDVGPDVNAYDRARRIAGVDMRIAGAPNFRHLTINGTSPNLRDVRVRQALAMGIDRAAIARALLGPLGFEPRPLNNHIFMTNQTGYQDNSGAVGAYNPERAAQLLDEAGWLLQGAGRTQDERPLEIQFVIPSAVPTSQQEAELIQNMLAQLGVMVAIQVVPAADFFDQYITPGQFDFTVFSWIGTPFPISSTKSIYVNPQENAEGEMEVQQNYARVGSEEIDQLFDQANTELDRERAVEIANQIDALIWQEVHSLTLYQRPEIYATREGLANFGAFGFAQPPAYEDIGWAITP